MQASYKEGLMILKANNNTVRLAPSLNISTNDIEKGVKKLEKAIFLEFQSKFLHQFAQVFSYTKTFVSQNLCQSLSFGLWLQRKFVQCPSF